MFCPTSVTPWSGNNSFGQRARASSVLSPRVPYRAIDNNTRSDLASPSPGLRWTWAAAKPWPAWWCMHARTPAAHVS